jgi:hypothetical protein
MVTVLSLARFLLRAAVPYPDPLRRRRIRNAARRLITCEPWPGDDATTLDIAQLALLRALWLQKQTRSSARTRDSEATALLARGAIETCISGLYWLYGDDPVARMSGSNAKSFRRFFSYLADGDPITPALIGDVSAAIGTPRDLPTLGSMADVVAVKTGHAFAKDLYDRFYIPLSTLFAHASGLALLRHVAPNDQLEDEPTGVWTRRSAAHVADAAWPNSQRR